MSELQIHLRTLTPLWTGGVDQTCDRLHETGLIGSLRWWYEALVRGLGGYACDPTSEDRCPDQDGKHCVACELFGCTGWARKFRFLVLDKKGEPIQSPIQANQLIIFRFVPLRPIHEEEWCLLHLTVRWIAEYGALGGKTVFKPSDETDRADQMHHRDYGLLEFVQSNFESAKTLDELKKYVRSSQWRTKDGNQEYSWVSIANFWCVRERYLARQNATTSTFNQVVGRKQPKQQARQQPKGIINHWLAGGQQESKKVFSFKQPARTFGFVKPGLVSFDIMKTRLSQVWQTFNADREFLTGEQILNTLCAPQGGQQ